MAKPVATESDENEAFPSSMQSARTHSDRNPVLSTRRYWRILPEIKALCVFESWREIYFVSVVMARWLKKRLTQWRKAAMGKAGVRERHGFRLTFQSADCTDFRRLFYLRFVYFVVSP
jgi:hypothetical protein